MITTFLLALFMAAPSFGQSEVMPLGGEGAAWGQGTTTINSSRLFIQQPVMSLLPALIGPQKPPVSMCIMTAVALCGFAVAYGSLEMWGAMVSVLICAFGWGYLAWQQR